MKETEPQTIIFNFDLTHRTAILLILAILGASLLGYLAWGSRPATAASPQAPSAGSTGLRMYYLSGNTTFGNGPLDQCGTGYHMASLWEIVDTSNLQYNTSLGYMGNADQGSGPPTGNNAKGWVRTGGASSTNTTPGIGNCANWTSDSSGDYGTLIYLDDD